MTKSDSHIAEAIALTPRFMMFSSKINIRDLILKEFHLFIFKEFRCPENTYKVLSVHYFSSDRPKIKKGLMVDICHEKQ